MKWVFIIHAIYNTFFLFTIIFALKMRDYQNVFLRLGNEHANVNQ